MGRARQNIARGPFPKCKASGEPAGAVTSSPPMRTKRPPRAVWLVLLNGVPSRALGSRRDALEVEADVAADAIELTGASEARTEVVGPYVLTERVRNR